MQLWQIVACGGAGLAMALLVLWLIGDKMAQVDEAHDDSWGDFGG